LRAQNQGSFNDKVKEGKAKVKRRRINITFSFSHTPALHTPSMTFLDDHGRTSVIHRPERL